MSKVLIVVLLGLICFSQATLTVPYFGQHDSRWGNKILGFGPTTISEEGCFLSTITSMVAREGIEINGNLPNPSTMNAWLKSKKDFSNDILFYDAPEDLGFTFEGIVKGTTAIKNALNQGKYAHLHVLHGTHWVLATGTTSGGYTVMDPGNAKIKTYQYGDVVGCAVYSAPSRRMLEEQHVDSTESKGSDAAHDAPSPIGHTSKHFKAHNKRRLRRQSGK